MIYNLIELVVCLFAIYGLIMLGYKAVVHIRVSGPGKASGRSAAGLNCPPRLTGVRMVLLVRNAEEQIEYIVRTAVKNDFASRVLSENSLVIIDMNSTDNTCLMLERLQKDFSNVEALRFEDRELIFNELTIFSHPPK